MLGYESNNNADIVNMILLLGNEIPENILS